MGGITMNKPYKTIERENGKIEIYGNNHWIELEYEVPEWNEETQDLEECFNYKGNKYFLSQFMNIHNKVHNPNPPEWMKEFDGYHNDSYFSGILIKLSDTGEAVKVYTYIS
jgi:hypothetical protein